ncbi:hypothetical protein [Stutzerimonas azotifigens]|uniref:Uncharacterized protein n=1 Tax=Stutzerimonas azotifigens TaxID=291995 RepID=A0ABR5Z2L4_9GAMM|nr:hypothetical protein [Stutzerimonas azotifigens]MBA1274453.1 hypothetical protein [Stutzerimonas azotifigens]
MDNFTERCGTLLAMLGKSADLLKRIAMKVQGNVIHLHQRVPGSALESLNRLTGLNFSRWPESLVRQPERGDGVPAKASGRDEPLERLGS